MKRKLLSTFAAALVAMLAVAAVPPPDGFEYAESETDVFFHRTACGEGQTFHIDLLASQDAGDGCGTIAGVSQILNEAFIAADQDPLFLMSYPSQGPFDLRLDGSRDLEGAIVLSPDLVGAGRTDVELTFSGQVDGQFVSFGTATGTVTMTPAIAEYEVPFSLDLADTLHGERLTQLTVDLVVRGVAVNQDFMAYSGDSFFTVPTLKLVEVQPEA